MATKQQKHVDNPVADRLKTLYDLQKVLTHIDEIRTVRGELPLEVQDLEDEIEGMNTRVNRYKDEIQKVTLSINKWKEERIQAQAKIEKNTENLNNVSNSREYDNLTKEIEYQNLEIQLRDKRISEGAVRKEELEKSVETNAAELTEREKELAEKSKELDSIIAENKADEDRLRGDAKILEENIEPRLLTAFKRIRKNSHNGLGIVAVERDACGGCFARIAPQRQLEVKFHKKIIVCESCGRILIDPELAGIEVAKPVVEEKKKRRATRKKKGE